MNRSKQSISESAIWRESTFGVVTEAGLRLVLSQVSESGPPAPSFGEAEAVEEPAFDHAKWQLQAKGYARNFRGGAIGRNKVPCTILAPLPLKLGHGMICSTFPSNVPNATRVWAPVQLGCRWSRSTPVRMIFYSSLDVMRLPVNRKPPGWSTQFSPCKLQEEPSPVPARLFGPVRCNRRLSLCSATLPVESEAKA